MKKLILITTLLFICSLNMIYAQWTTIWSEDFENDWTQNWTPSNGTWDVGVPTSGPFNAHSSDSCAATELGGDYPDNIDTDLHLKPSSAILLPNTSQKIRLRFWHWFSFSSSDNGYVKIKTPTSTTWTTLNSYTYYNTCGNVWTVEEIDLSEWRDSSVQIAFHLHTADAPGNGSWDVSSGWYIDDLEISYGDYIFNVHEDFESGYGDWSVDRGSWEIGNFSNGVGPGSTHSGSALAGTVISGNYHDNNDTKLRTPWFNVPDFSQNPRFRFWHWFSLSSYDNARIQIRTNPDSAWVDLINYTYYNTCSGVWSVDEIDLSGYANQNIQLAFYMHTGDAPGNGSWDVSTGWYIDDVELRTGNINFSANEDFEFGYRDWSVDRGTWEIGEPISGPNSGYLSSNCAATSLENNYDDNIDSRLRTPWITLAQSFPELSFRQWFNFSSGDYGQVVIRTHPDSAWQTVSQQFGSAGTNWTYLSLPLNNWAGQVVQIGFLMHSYDSPGNGSWDVSSGWYIDDVNISSTTSIKENYLDLQVKLYPNPASSSFTILLEKLSNNGKIEVIDHLGKIVHTDNLLGLSHTVNCEDYSKGIYYIKIQTVIGTSNQKMVIY